MNSFNIIYKECGKYSAIIYPVSYINPLDEVTTISEELKRHLKVGSYVLFDFLLSNGDNFNRFAEYLFDGNDVNIGSISITEMSSDQINRLNMYYRGKTKELRNSVLSSREQFKYATIK